MPLYLKRYNDGFSVYSGGYEVGGFGPHDTGPRPIWTWAAGTPFDTTGASTETAAEARDMVAASWRAMIAKVGLEEIPDLPKRIGEPAGPAPNSAHLDPLPYMLQREHGDGRSPYPDDQYVVLQGEAVAGILVHDPCRNWDPRIIRERWPKPWLWHIYLRADPSGIPLHGNVDTLDQAREQHAIAWRRWLAWAGLRQRL